MAAGSPPRDRGSHIVPIIPALALTAHPAMTSVAGHADDQLVHEGAVCSSIVRIPMHPSFAFKTSSMYLIDLWTLR